MFVDYIVTLTGASGETIIVTSNTFFKLRLLNPCFDPNLVQIKPVALPIGMSYTLYANSPLLPFPILTHQAWSYTTTPIAHTLCGSIHYTATFEGNVADETTAQKITYSSDNRTFSMYSEDLDLIGFRTVTVSAFLTDYSMIVQGPESVQIEIVDPCLTP